MSAGTRRSIWAWGLESDEPSHEERVGFAKSLSEEWGRDLPVPKAVPLASIELRPPRIEPDAGLAPFCASDPHERAFHHYGSHFTERLLAFRGEFPNPPDFVAHPSDEDELERVLAFCTDHGCRAVPWGGGSSVVYGVSVPEDDAPCVTIDLDRLDRVLEIDETSRAARIQAGILGPALEDALRPNGYTLRHFPQSFEWSTLGGWIATRSGGHYATNHTHIDDFVESLRMLTPSGWWESRRLPGSGAGPSPDRLAIGSEGILGVISEAWMRIQRRPRFRATAGVRFDSWEASAEAARHIAQAKLWPANLRLLDPREAKNAGLDGSQALLIVGFESAELPQEVNIQQAVGIARECGGQIGDDEIRVSDASEKTTGREGAVGAWRSAFIGVGKGMNLITGLGLIADTFETSITWDRWPEFDREVRARVEKTLAEVAGGGALSCRFTHVYPDGPAPYYTFSTRGTPGGEIEQWQAIKKAATDAVLSAGGTSTHHHSVGRMHREGYDRQRPELFARALRAAKRELDPGGLLNPGVLIDP
ncbi:MAG: FAD-binding oxidoreductase [Deltaproteobacteria bacterium]|jgi:alkyldihydroxyacetonephosphate synthase|nr:FAD-binding oxidoreductase [Deltaproteobacteria bacterium]